MSHVSTGLLNTRRCPNCGAANAVQQRSEHQTRIPGHLSRGRSSTDPMGVLPGSPLPQETAADPLFAAQLAAVREIEGRHVSAGCNLISLCNGIVTHPSLLDWLTQSDEVASSIKGRRDLVKRRRHGILRWLDGPDRGMPFHLPPQFVTSEISADRELRLFRLRDELEYIALPFTRRVDRFAPGPRPVRDTLTHPLVRAILDWKASHLDAWLSAYPHLIGGRIYHPIPPDARETLDAKARTRGKEITQPREYLTEVRFDTARFMAWYYGNMN
ncbi:MAG: hypothetical protein QOI24_1209 [Acidobacteriota bacterium]|nr:hypothetical protein [Acidobacteriota bacterium]